jgi:glycosyltransferase involved in cell wall biosynthesis
MKKLLIVGPTPPPVHGVSQAIGFLLQSNLSEKFNVIHLELADRRGIEFVNQPDFHDLLLFLKQWIRLNYLYLKLRPDLTYLPISQTTIGFVRDSLFLLIAIFWRSKIVLHLHSGNFRTWYRQSGNVTRWHVRFILNRIDRMIVLGNSLKSIFDGLIEPGRISVVPNGLPWTSQTDRSGGVVRFSGKVRILHLSTLTRLKGAMVLLRAIPLVLKHFKEVEFIFAGNWYRKEEREEGESIVIQEKLEPFVLFTGEVQGLEKRDLFESSDLFVFPGVQQEGQPLVVIEAMAAGLPVIYTNRGCLRETVIDGVTGLEVETNNVSDLANKIVWMLSYPEERKKMAAQSRLRYENSYTQARFEANMAEVFEKAAQ